MSATLEASLKKRALLFADFFTKKDALGIGELLDDHFSLFDPALKWVQGKRAVVELLQQQFADAKAVNYQVVRAFQDGNTSILEFVLTMDQKTFVGVDFIERKEGKMIELLCHFNPP
ncbi:MAG: nuclear transport factor 2 family protein [Verrucomicrobia bacterium]|nr:nuclear transport factor 2 family protein [Verrucomicrobiota bacterium]